MKLNSHIKRQKLSSQQLYDKIDLNKNGLIEREEFITFFSQTMPVQGVPKQDLAIVFDALDHRKEGTISINVFCLYLEGAQLTMAQRLSQFDQDFEKELQKEINTLFDFFDKNGD